MTVLITDFLAEKFIEHDIERAMLPRSALFVGFTESAGRGRLRDRSTPPPKTDLFIGASADRARVPPDANTIRAGLFCDAVFIS